MYNYEQVEIIRRYRAWEVVGRRYRSPKSLRLGLLRYKVLTNHMAGVEETKHYADGILVVQDGLRLFFFRTRDSVAGPKDPPEVD